MNLQTKLAVKVMQVTGWEFPKYGFFGRDGLGRRALRAIGVKAVAANWAAHG